MVRRRWIVGLWAIAAAWGVAGSADAGLLTNPILPGSVSIRLQTIATLPAASGAPNFLTHAGDSRRFVTGQLGEIKIINDSGLVATPFLDVGSAGIPFLNGGERGLLGMAFHPNYTSIGQPGYGKLYTYTSETNGGNTPDFFHPELGSLPTAGNHHSLIREWTVDFGTNPDVVDVGAGSRVLMRIQQPQANHNGGALVFGPDKNLYISLGDGGGGNDNSGGASSTTDGHTNSPGAGLPHGNAQDITNILGSIVRIDPVAANPIGVGPGDVTISANGQYYVPNSNPFVGVTGVDEIYAYGLRNPWRISFDPLTGDLWAGDVGQGAREEVDKIESGKNYGWVTLEGTRVNFGSYTTAGLVAPVGEFVQVESNGGTNDTVIGGFVYRGSLIPELQGKYVLGDLGVNNSATGRLYTMDTGTGLIEELVLDALSEAIPDLLHGFGQDNSGELYAMFSNGSVVRINAVPEASSFWLLAVAAAGLGAMRWLGRAGPCRRARPVMAPVSDSDTCTRP